MLSMTAAARVLPEYVVSEVTNYCDTIVGK